MLLVFRKRPTFESDWDMHVLLFFLVPTHRRELNARDKTICASLRNDKLSSRGKRRGVGAVRARERRGGVEMYRARMHLSLGERGGGGGRRRIVRGARRNCTRNAGR